MTTPTWDNAPEWGYKGFRYMPHLDEVKHENGNIMGVHIWHDIYRHSDTEQARSKGGYCQPAMTSNSPSDRFMTEAEFKKFIDYMERVTA
jgi:hypothetical protein